MNPKTQNRIAFALVALLAITFVALKLAGAIAWTWWWVLSPVWMAVAVVLAVFIASAFIVWLFKP